MHYAKNVTGRNAYLNKVKTDLRATMSQVGACTIFWTLSCADFHWPEFHSLFDSGEDHESMRQNVTNNPHILDWLFTVQTENFVKRWLYDTLGASWYRFEFAVQRCSIHCHRLPNLKNDPGLCHLTKIALKGYLSSEKKTSVHVHNMLEVQLNQIEMDIISSKQAEKQVCDCVDSLMSTCNPCNPDNMTWVKPKIHPCKRRYNNIPSDEWDDDYVGLITMVLQHSKCNYAYCLRKNKKGSLYCRFDYPFDKCDKTHLVYEEVDTKDGIEDFKVNVCY